MLITKEHQEAMLKNYAKKGNDFDKCEGFTDGLNAMLDYVIKLDNQGAKKNKKTITIPENFNLKYFTNLDPNQKKRTINYLRIFKNKLENEKYKDALLLLKEDEKEINEIENLIKKQKVFRDQIIKTYFPLNYEEIITS